MMSKRTGFQFRQPKAKMPKLDITISSSQMAPQPGPSTRHNQIVAAQRPPPVRDSVPQSVDMWDDDDEELIMLASQVAEKVEANAEELISQSMNITYSTFQRQAHQVSTQRQRHINDLDDYFRDGDEVFSKLIESPNDLKISQIVEGLQSDLVPMQIDDEPVVVLDDEPPEQEAANAQGLFVDKQKKAEQVKAEAQTAFMSNRLREQKKEIETLKENLTKISDKCQTKEGEASTLRYELEYNKQQYDKLRKEKIAEIQNMEKDYVEKITNMEKTIEAQQSEIAFKNMEMLNKRSRRSMNDSIVGESSFRESTAVDQSFGQAEAYALFKLESICLRTQEDAIPIKVDPLHIHTNEMNQALNNKDASLLKLLPFFQMALHQINRLKQSLLDDKLMKDIFNFSTDLILSLRNSANNLEMQKCAEYNPALEYKILSENMRLKKINNRKAASIQETPAPVIVGERLLFERRILSAIAVLCTHCQNITKMLLELPLPVDVEMNEQVRTDTVSAQNETFVSVLIEVLMNVGFAKNLDLYCGLINASASFLNAIVGNYVPSEANNAAILKLFKAIVFCQPDIFSLEKLTDFLEAVSKQSQNVLLNELCHNLSNNIVNYPVYNIKIYSLDTCPLQVYASHLEVAFEQVENMSFDSVKLTMLTEITIKLMTILRNCFKRPVTWLFRNIDNGNENGPICHCYCHIVSCTIVLLYLCIKHWIANPQIFDLKQIKIIFEMATIFLYDNFSQHYEPKVLQLGDVFIKNRLQILYDWIIFYQHLFKFGSAHNNAIKSVNLRRIMLMNEPQRVSTQQQQNSTVQGGNSSTILKESFDTFF